MSQYSKKNQQQLHYLPIQAKRGSLPHQAQEALTRSMAGNSSASGSRGNQPFSNASGRTSDNKYASQERAMKMAEDNLNKIDEILAQNQKHIQ
jgi:flagellin-like hook-associated protein FlgL